MMRSCLAIVLLTVICFGCASETQTNFPITWRQDEDEIVLYLDFSGEASSALIRMLDETVTFEQVSDFLVQNTDSKIPFYEGALTSAAITARRAVLQGEMERKRSQDGLVVEIIGFKENPVQIVKGALVFSRAPKYLANFDPGKNPEVVKALLELMDGSEFVVGVHGRFPGQ
jgi:hypothetical protein